MTTKTQSKSPAPVIEGTVINKDAVVFVAPKTAKERQAASAANTSRIRQSIATMEGEAGRLLSYLVLALVLTPATGNDGTDALDALRKGDGAVEGLTAKMVSYARAAHVLVSSAGITSTEDPRWNVALGAAHRQGIGAERITNALSARRAGNARRAMAERILEDAAAVKGKEREAVLAKAFPSKRNSDGNKGTGSKAFRAASDALTKMGDALKVKTADGGMTDEERAEVAAHLARLTERAGQPA